IDVRGDQERGQAIGEIRINGRVLARLADGGGSRTALQRAQAFARRFDDMFLQRSVMLRDLRLGDDGQSLVADGEVLLQLLPADARLAKKSQAQVAADALKTIQTELWREQIDELY